MKQQTIKGKQFEQAYKPFIKSGKTYVGLIPLLEDENLKCPARILFLIISSFCYVEGFCFATNKTLGNRLGLKEAMVKQYLSELRNNQLIETKMVTHSYGIGREIYINFTTLRKRYLKKP